MNQGKDVEEGRILLESIACGCRSKTSLPVSLDVCQCDSPIASVFVGSFVVSSFQRHGSRKDVTVIGGR
jgi:hypothetical protein